MRINNQKNLSQDKSSYREGKFILKANQYVSFSNLTFDKNSTSLVIAGTGMGKTTAVLNDLRNQYECIIFVLPSTLKVQELEQSFRKSKTNSILGTQNKFYYNNHSPNETDMKNFRGLIVCTYDKFMKVDRLIPDAKKVKSIVVVDECHKLYATGDYRDEALLPMICTLRKCAYKHTLYMTATFTQERWDILELPICQKFEFTAEKPRQRQIEVLHYPKGDQYTFLQKVGERLEHIQANHTAGKVSLKIFIRINNRKRCEMIAKYLEDSYKARCLIIHGKNKHEPQVKVVFEQEKIPDEIDVILSTSILDEGINLNNLQEEVDSLFVVGKSAHPEELIQYLGRLRYAIVPCFLVIHTPMETHPLNQQTLDKLHTTYTKKIDELLENVQKVADLIVTVNKDFVNLTDDYSSMFDTDDDETVQFASYLQTRDKLTKLNATFLNWVNAKLFGIFDNKITRNYPSLAAFSYRIDMSKCYDSFYYLKFRLNGLDPNLKIKLTTDTALTTPTYVKDYFDEQEEVTAQQIKSSIDDAFNIFLTNHDVFEDDIPNPTNLTNIARDYSLEMESDEGYLQDLVFKNKAKHPKACVENLTQIISLSRHLGSLHDIKDVLQNAEYANVLRISEAYRNDLLVTYMLKYFKRHKLKTIKAGGLTIKSKDAQKFILQGFKQLTERNNLPIETIIERKLIKSIRYNKFKNSASIKDSVALNFIKKYFDVEDKNSHKPDKRYLILHNLVYRNYHFLALDDIIKRELEEPKPFIVKGIRYDSQTGLPLDDTKHLSKVA